MSFKPWWNAYLKYLKPGIDADKKVVAPLIMEIGQSDMDEDDDLETHLEVKVVFCPD